MFAFGTSSFLAPSRKNDVRACRCAIDWNFSFVQGTETSGMKTVST